jgi:hypothetical protein
VTVPFRGAALRSLTEHNDTGMAAGQMLYSVLGAVRNSSATSYANAPSPASLPPSAAASVSGFALTLAQIREAKKMLARRESPNHVARVLRVGRSTLYRAIAR